MNKPADISEHAHTDEHRDDIGSRFGMWLFIFTELLLFAGLFITYSVFRYKNWQAFHLAAEELDTFIGALNTVILLISSATIAMSITAIQKKQKILSLALMGVTILIGIIFLINKYFEWSLKIEHGLYPGSEILLQFGQGEVLFFGLYFFMTGLHALHIIAGLVFIGFVFYYMVKDRVRHDDFVLLENAGLYWHLVDIIWIFLFPLFYLIT
jgi:cytochrome c oxidase subunit III